MGKREGRIKREDELSRHVPELLERGFHLIPLHGVFEDGTCRCDAGEDCNRPGTHVYGKGVATCTLKCPAG